MLEEGDELALPGLREALLEGTPLTVENRTRGTRFTVTPSFTERELANLLAGGLLNLTRSAEA
jgi:aconitate hydratase